MMDKVCKIHISVLPQTKIFQTLKKIRIKRSKNEVAWKWKEKVQNNQKNFEP